MKIAEHVTFGGGGLDRAATRRPQAEALRAQPESRGVVLWRGKLLVQQDALVRVACDHPITQEAGPTVVYLGQAEGQDVFAFDISDWEPAEQDTQSVDLFRDPSVQVHPLFDDGSHFAELRGIMAQLSPLDAEIAATAKGILGWHETHRFCAKCGNPSASAAGGWQRDCDACHAHHFPRTDPVVIMLITHGNSVLVGRSPGWPEGMYSLLAGFVEPGETIEAAVRREVLEESGIKVGEVGYLASQPWPFPSSLMFGCRGTALNTDITLDPNELEDALWISREDMAAVFAGRP